MKSLSAFAAIAALGTALSGCATITKGTSQPVAVTTAPVRGADCTLANSEGTWHLRTPGSVTVHESRSDLEVTCAKDGFANGHAVAAARIGAATLGNAIIGGAAGLAVDAASGADFHYDSPILVKLGAPSGRPAAYIPAAVTASALAASQYPVYLHCEDPAVDAVFIANGAPGHVTARVRFEFNTGAIAGSVFVTRTDTASCTLGSAKGTVIASADYAIDANGSSIAGVTSAADVAPYIEVAEIPPQAGGDGAYTFTIAAKDDSPGIVTLAFPVVYK
jgi:hypothetical protein